MTALFTKNGRTSAIAAFLMLAVAVGGAFAQNGKKMAPGSDIGVAKNMADYEEAMCSSIQEAVNKARAGQVIEILDTETYNEQVTIDGRDKSPWIASQTSGKNGITIRYVPAGGAAAGWNHPRPTIKYRDTQNTHPKNKNEAEKESEIDGAGNFETNGALRILRAKGVTIEGIAVDGGGSFTFGAEGVWCPKPPKQGDCSSLNHGNAAITLAVASQVTIRDCDLKNAFFGINVKDRNTGGVFGNPNPSDNDTTVPLSGFGAVGGHLFEYNKINNNVFGMFFESAWDLGSTARYNLIYQNNKITNDTTWKWVGDGTGQHNGGAFYFKDMYLSPVAIYNNTFYDNTGNFVGQWQAGGQHLIFNNIFSKSSPSANVNHMSLDGAFPNRMHFNVFSADASLIETQCRKDSYNCAANAAIAPGGCWVQEIKASSGSGFTRIEGSNQTLRDCNGSSSQTQKILSPGALIPSVKTIDNAITLLPAANENRWLQTEGSGTQLPNLFKSLTPTSADFLVPNWEDTLVKKYIMNKGWPLAGIRNNDGSMADLGAIPSTGVRQTTVARIIPTNVVFLTGGGANATANFNLKVNSGTVTSPKIKLLRWIAPVPENNTEATNWPSKVQVIPTTSISPQTGTLNPTPNAVTVGNNAFSFSTNKNTDPKYGFFEIIVEGTDANGKTVTSDVGFLPYRKLEYFFDITVYDGTAAVTTVKAGQPYRIHVERRCAQGVNPCPSTVNEIEYSLLSDPTAFIRKSTTGDTLAYEKNVTFPKDYDGYYFSRAGAETIFASGLYISGSNRATFIGTKDITVRPGDPAKAVFTDPIPVSQLGTAPAPVINRGVDRPVTVEVQDMFGNAVDTAVQVTVSSSNDKIGDVGASPSAMNTKTASTDPKTGVVTFTAKVTNGAMGQTFDMTATIPKITQTDKDNIGRLRLGRPLDRLEVFYSDTGSSKNVSDYYKHDVTIDKNVGEWEKITVKVVVSDTVRTDNPTAKFVLVSRGDDNLVFSATENGTLATVFPLNAGVATFWVGTAPGTDRSIENAGINVYALRTNDPNDRDQSVSDGSRVGINFTKLSNYIRYAVVYGDGQGRPDSMIIVYTASLNDAGAKPTRVTLKWGGGELTAAASVMEVKDDVTLKVNSLTPSAGAKPTGYTSIAGSGIGLVTVYGGSAGADAVEAGFEVYDGVGPVLANGVAGDGAGSAGPRIYDNDGKEVDTLSVTISEDINVRGLTTLLYSAGPGEPAAGAAGTRLDVIEVLGAGPTYKLVVRTPSGGVKPEVNGWIRLDPEGSDVVTDLAGAQSGGVIPNNKPNAANRWVQLKPYELTPEVRSAWYTGNNVVGKPNFAYVVFNKQVKEDWFVDSASNGTVKFGRQGVFGAPVTITAGNISELFPEGLGHDTLKVDLVAAAAAIAVSGPIKTDGDIDFSFVYQYGKDWTGGTSGVAKDRAAPVLAKPAVLKTGSPKKDGSFNQDTLIVYYSEPINPASAAGVDNKPLRLKAKGGMTDRFGEDQPKLSLSGSIDYDRTSGFYLARYVVDDPGFDINKYPEPDDSVQIYSFAKVGDRVDPSNLQDDPANKWQPLKVERAANWTVKIGPNPFTADASGTKFMNMEFSPNAKGVTTVEVTARITIFDNIGTKVVDTTIDNSATGEKRVIFPWSGVNMKGRLVGTGTYLLRATCTAKAGEDSRADVYRVPQRMLGVVRGRQ
ncbi:hypothetical protein R80B4_00083 [Fibrobacteres bacterium R8-0-B4]